MRILDWFFGRKEPFPQKDLSQEDLRHLHRIVYSAVQPLVMEVIKMNAIAQKLSNDIDALKISVDALIAKPAGEVPATDAELAAMDAKLAEIKTAVDAAVTPPVPEPAPVS